MGGILYSILKNFGHRAIAVVIPAFVIMGITYLSSFGNCGLVWRPTTGVALVDCGLVRGIAEMGLGILLGYVMMQRKHSLCNHIAGINTLGVLGFVGLLLIALARQNYDVLSLFLIPMVILACEHPKSLFGKLLKSKIWNQLGQLSMYMYFIHLFVAASFYIVDSRVSNALTALPAGILFVFYLILCLLGAMGLRLVTEKLYDKTFNKQ